MLHKIVSMFVAAITVLILALWLLTLRSFHKFTVELNKESIIREADRLQLEESSKLIQTLSSQRHDFKNQLQIIRMLAQMGKSEEITRYIQEYNTMMDSSNSIFIHINNPAISAMLLVFSTEAKEKDVRFSVDCDADFTNFNLSPVAVTRVVGNIIRNAIEILEISPNSERAIQITIWEAANYFNFIIWNNGPVIPEDQMEKIFTSGFSTKSSSGLGLSIAKQILEELGGQIIVNSSAEKGTEFKIIFPKSSSRAVLTEQSPKMLDVIT
jgi:Signal transduction histidine kinase regulating citrate/malate metabolism